MNKLNIIHEIIGHFIIFENVNMYLKKKKPWKSNTCAMCTWMYSWFIISQQRKLLIIIYVNHGIKFKYV